MFIIPLLRNGSKTHWYFRIFLKLSKFRQFDDFLIFDTFTASRRCFATLRKKGKKPTKRNVEQHESSSFREQLVQGKRHVRPRSTSRRDHVAKVAARGKGERERERGSGISRERADQEATWRNATERRAENTRDDRDYSRFREFVVSLIESPRVPLMELSSPSWSSLVRSFLTIS